KGIDESGTQTGTGGTVIDNGLYGVGSSSLANESRNSTDETRDFADSKTTDETVNLTDAESGTVDHDTSEKLTFTGRKDATDGSDTEKGSVKHNTQETLTFSGRADSTDSTESH